MDYTITAEVAREAIQRAMDDVNETRTPDTYLELEDDYILIGDGGKLDSLGLITFLVALEERLSEMAGKPVTLLTENNLIPQGPLHTVGMLVTHITDDL